MGMAEVLRSIKDAEQAAEKRLSNAQDESSKIMSDARRKASELITEATDDSVMNTQSVLDKSRKAANKDADKVKSKGAKGVESIESSANGQQGDAVQLIVDSLMPQ
jgi:V/A-type H+-transporting ATPase subunit G/H